MKSIHQLCKVFTKHLCKTFFCKTCTKRTLTVFLYSDTCLKVTIRNRLFPQLFISVFKDMFNTRRFEICGNKSWKMMLRLTDQQVSYNLFIDFWKGIWNGDGSKVGHGLFMIGVFIQWRNACNFSIFWKNYFLKLFLTAMADLRKAFEDKLQNFYLTII